MPAPLMPGQSPLNMAAVNVSPPAPDEEALRDEALVTWILDKVDTWEQYRENNFSDNWKEYYRSWKQVWTRTCRGSGT